MGPPAPVARPAPATPHAPSNSPSASPALVSRAPAKRAPTAFTGGPPGQPADGQVVPGFAAPLSGTVRALAVGGDSLYVGGNFRTQIKNGIPKEKSIARLDATTGAPDASFTFTLGDPIPKDALQVEYM